MTGPGKPQSQLSHSNYLALMDLIRDQDRSEVHFESFTDVAQHLSEMLGFEITVHNAKGALRTVEGKYPTWIIVGPVRKSKNTLVNGVIQRLSQQIEELQDRVLRLEGLIHRITRLESIAGMVVTDTEKSAEPAFLNWTSKPRYSDVR